MLTSHTNGNRNFDSVLLPIFEEVKNEIVHEENRSDGPRYFYGLQS